ncbi:MAG: DUF29 domain-containing protein [Acetobacteraceae bacterium]|nr:DUF29 domain-containing protein [Acetobacteraceae bacterium]
MSGYDTDVYAWSIRQGALLRRIAAGERVNDADIDWPSIAEEVESVGRSERAALLSRISTILEHLIKLRISPAIDSRRGWSETALRSRLDVEDLLQDSPSLRQCVGDIIARRLPAARRLALAALESQGEHPVSDPELLVFDEAQVLGDWFPD